MSRRYRGAYQLINASSAPIWVAMIFAPRARITRRLAERVTPFAGALGAIYAPLLTAGQLRQRRVLDFRDPDAVIAALATPETFLAAWSHYIAFDLFVGRWIWSDALEHDRTAPVALLLTWLFGPAGLGVYLARRGSGLS